MTRRIDINVEMRVTMDVEEGVDVSDALIIAADNMTIDNSLDATIENAEITNYEIMDSK